MAGPTRDDIFAQIDIFVDKAKTASAKDVAAAASADYAQQAEEQKTADANAATLAHQDEEAERAKTIEMIQSFQG